MLILYLILLCDATAIHHKHLLMPTRPARQLDRDCYRGRHALKRHHIRDSTYSIVLLTATERSSTAAWEEAER